ncbi:MAG: protease modulator HflC [Lachnospiraceae bacterium]|nr:protease modulator HflC [Lachnospiraceae bacterium]
MAEAERFDSNGNPVSKKKRSKVWLWVVLGLVLLILLDSSLVVCHEDEYKLIRRFGRVERTISTAGLNFKVPFIESVDTIPRQILLYDIPPSDVITSDKKSMIIDSYVLWEVTDPLLFAQTLSCSIANAENRIDMLVYNAMKNKISNMTQDEVIRSRDGKMTITDVVAEEDVQNNDIVLEEKTKVVQIKSLTEEIMDHIGTVYEQYGIRILTVEVKKLDLPDDNKQAVYTRMISERENIAAQYTAEGASQAQMIKNTTDKEVSIMLSEAKADAEEIRAEGEAEYMRILSDAYADTKKSDFYTFVRALDAAKESMRENGGEKTLLLPADSPIAQIFTQGDFAIESEQIPE